MIKIYKYGEVSNSEIFSRENIASNVEGIVSEIIANVILNKDKALYEYSAKFDKAELRKITNKNGESIETNKDTYLKNDNKSLVVL